MKNTRVSNTSVLMSRAIICMLLFCQVTRADFIFGEPEMVPNVNSIASDSAPQISRNGLELYFSSTRDTGMNRIWVSKRLTTKDAWPAPTPIDTSVDPVSEQVFPSLSADGLELYYADGTVGTADPAGYGDSDIWVLTRASISDPWNAPQNLGSVINTSSEENSPCISADGLELYYVSNVPNYYHNSEIVMTTRASKHDPWGKPVTLNSNVNDLFYEYNPFLSTDGLSLFFSSGLSLQQVYVASRPTTEDTWTSWQFFTPVNGFGTTHNVSYSAEDSTIYFTQGSNVFALDFNIWQVKVTPVVDLNDDGAVDTFDVFELLGNWGPTDKSLYDIAPMPFGDGVVNGEDLIVLAEHMIIYEQSIDVNGL
ncbi:MAG: PD40 domain-containing protein [Phycisphaeraceae bacterium]|nr:PD40 domain-containing protein [Phycisphaeraceae bacterium]